MIKNALKFTNQGFIRILACYVHERQNLIVHVQDSGAGIANEDIPKLFSQFGRLHRTAEINNDGIGLGLTIVK